jgi:hypothetical protein
MPTEISGILVLNQYSTDDGITWKTIVCEDTSQISITASDSEKKTKCGTFTSTSLNAVSITGSGVAGGDLSGTQASYLDLANLVTNMTPVTFRRQNAVSGTVAEGEVTYFYGQGKFIEATETAPTEESVGFNWAFKSSGDYELTSAS